MSRLAFGFHVLAMLLLWGMPASVGAGETILGPPEAKAVEYSPERHINPITLLPIEVNGRWGYADRRGDIVIEPRYEWVDYLYGPFMDKDLRQIWLARYLYEGKMDWMVITGTKRDQKSSRVKANAFHVYDGGSGAATRYANGSVVMGQGTGEARRFYLVEADGDWLTDAIYTGMLRVKSGYSAVESNGRCGFVDQRGKVVVPLEFAEIRSI